MKHKFSCESRELESKRAIIGQEHVPGSRQELQHCLLSSQKFTVLLDDIPLTRRRAKASARARRERAKAKDIWPDASSVHIGRKGKKSQQKGESSSSVAHIAEEEQEEAEEEETLLTKKKKQKPQGVASAAHEVEEVDEEGFAYSIHHFELPVATSSDKKCLDRTEDTRTCKREHTSRACARAILSPLSTANTSSSSHAVLMRHCGLGGSRAIGKQIVCRGNGVRG